MKIYNLCEKPVKIYRFPDEDTDGSVMVFKNDAVQLGVSLTQDVYGETMPPDWVDNIVVTPVKLRFQMPPESLDASGRPQSYYIVPKEVAVMLAASGRRDILYPDNIVTEAVGPNGVPTYRGLYQFV